MSNNHSNRRSFLKNSLKLSVGYNFTHFLSEDIINQFSSINNNAASNDEDYWNKIAKAWNKPKDIINFNSGGVSPAPIAIQKAYFKNYEFSNQAPSYYMWRILDKNRELLRQQLAAFAGCQTEEIAINRNSTEALNTIIFGLPLKKGDEIIHALQEYPNMKHAWAQRAQRDGLIIKTIDLKLPIDNDDEIVNQYVDQFTKATKIVHLSHVVNGNGQILPIKKIIDHAHLHGIEVIVDAAHSFAQIPINIAELNADYMGASLHKWLYAPLGSGLLFIKKEKIKSIYTLLGNQEQLNDNIRKFEQIGTRNFASEMAIIDALTFTNNIGIEKKYERLKYLKHYWYHAIKDIPNAQFNTTQIFEKSTSIANLKLANLSNANLDAFLWKNYKIHATIFDYPSIIGSRITVNLFTTTKELDILIEAISKASKL
jgi:selenocysteine lyase/cysteine desulfurase